MTDLKPPRISKKVRAGLELMAHSSVRCIPAELNDDDGLYPPSEEEMKRHREEIESLEAAEAWLRAFLAEK